MTFLDTTASRRAQRHATHYHASPLSAPLSGYYHFSERRASSFFLPPGEVVVSYCAIYHFTADDELPICTMPRSRISIIAALYGSKFLYLTPRR